MTNLRKTKKAIIRAMCGVKLIQKKSSQAIIYLYGWEETLDRLAKANGVQWCGHA